jgi:dTMP kinase
METKDKGLFVCIEGIDGTGKTTFINNFQKNNKNTVTTRMPGGTDFAESLRDYARGAKVSPLTQMLTYSACINDCLENTVIPAYDQGKTVISDRSYLSTYAYQVCQNQSLLENAYIEIIKAAPIKPDLMIYIDLNLDTAIEREMNADRVDTADRYSQMHRDEKLKIFRNYQQLLDNPFSPIWKLLADRVVRVNGNCDAATLYERIQDEILLCSIQIATSRHAQESLNNFREDLVTRIINAG